MTDDEKLTHRALLELAGGELTKMIGNSFSPLSIRKPRDLNEALALIKIVSKLSPMLGNVLEFDTINRLNDSGAFSKLGEWIRQDPWFPDALFLTDKIQPNPWIEIKAWFPMATEITARFKESQNALSDGHVDVALIAWMPEYILYWDLRIIDVCVVSGKSIAEARDKHYHNPPNYIVMEPEDTSSRTKNLQQSNTNWFKLQHVTGSDESALFEKALLDANRLWIIEYSPSADFQNKVKEFRTKYNYRGDTNYWKIDRIEHAGIEAFKKRVLLKTLHWKTIFDWNKVLGLKNWNPEEQIWNLLNLT